MLGTHLFISGDDFSNYIVASERSQSLCTPMGSLNIELAPNLPRRINPYELVTFYERDTKVFTGYAYTFEQKRMPIGITLLCYDPLIKARDYWFPTHFESNGESVVHWISSFLKSAGLHSINVDVNEGATVFPGFGWYYTTALDAIKQCIQICPYQIYADADGVIQIVQIDRSNPPDHTIHSYAEFERNYNDSYVRNRVVIFGNGFMIDKYGGSNPYLLPGEVRSAVVATGQIHYEHTADRLATKMLTEFSTPVDEKTIVVEGNPAYKLGQIVDLTDSWSGYHRADCVITDITSNCDANTGYTTEITLDRRCANFWGWDSLPTIYPHLYTGTLGAGVYKGYYDCFSARWEEYNNGLTGSALSVKDLKQSVDGDLWAATNGGLYYREEGTDEWESKSLPEPVAGAGAPAVVSLCPSKLNDSLLYALGWTISGVANRCWLYKTANKATSWGSVEIGGGGGGDSGKELDFQYNASPRYQYFGHKFAKHNSKLYAIEYGTAIGTVRIWERSTGSTTWTQIGTWSTAPTGMDAFAIAGGSTNLWVDGIGIGTTTCKKRWDGTTWTNFTLGRNRDVITIGSNQAHFTDGTFPSAKTMYDQNHGYISNSTFRDETDPFGTYYGNVRHGIQYGSATFATGYDPYDSLFWIIRETSQHRWALEEETGARGIWGGFIEHGSSLYGACNNTRLLLRTGTSWGWDTATCSSNIRHACSNGGSRLFVGCADGIYEREGSSYTKHCTLDDVIRVEWFDGYVIAMCDGADPGIYRCAVGGAVEVKPLTSGRTHTIDADYSDNYIYTVVQHAACNYPMVFRTDFNLVASSGIYTTTSGCWGGVSCESTGVSIFGDFGAPKVLETFDGGENWTDLTCPEWGIGTLVRSVIYPWVSEPKAILYSPAQVWKHIENTNWQVVSYLPFGSNCGRPDETMGGIFVGRIAGGEEILQHSVNMGTEFFEMSEDLSHDYRIANIVVGLDDED